MRRELKIFFTALMFYTRIPCPKWVGHEPEYISLSIRYFPIIGWIVGAIATFSFAATSWLAGNLFGVLMSLVASILTTGAFHEDGFADACDGFGGGWTKEKILLIMKDSRVGAFGLIGMMMLMAIKVTLIYQIVEMYSITMVAMVFVITHAMSRFIAATFVFTHAYVSESAGSKSKPVAKQSGMLNLWVASIFSFLPLILAAYYFNNGLWLFIPPVLYFVKYMLGRYFNRWIGGYTGDCLGATQQVIEVVTYLLFIVLWKFS